MFTYSTELLLWSKHIIDSNENTFKILVPVGTLVSLYMGWRNSSHLRRQANIQREIENNRYKLELFDKRFKVFTEFKQKVITGNAPIHEADVNELNVVAKVLDNNISEIEKEMLIFGSDDNILSSFLKSTEIFKKLVLLTSAQIPLLQETRIKLGDIDDDTVDMNKTINHLIKINKKEMFIKQIEIISE